MTDEIDTVQALEALEGDSLIIQAKRAAAEIPQGNAGICDECTEFSPRLVNGICARCRDELNMD